MPTILHTYKNGNTNVSIYDDGTKIREYDDTPIPQHPESCDVKITNRCDNKCQFCHEKSYILGKEADLNKLMSIISDLPAGVELAVGGGNALSHPHLNKFLSSLKEKGLIANITVNQVHVNRHKSQLIKLILYGMIHGIGISCSPINSYCLQDIKDICDTSSNVVFHLINGINTLEDIDQLINLVGDDKCKILVLGFKKWGMGKKFYEDNSALIDNRIEKYYQHLHRYFKLSNVVMSFDNLAIEQLKLRRYFTDEGWDNFFMGKDGAFTMYIDAVEQQYAKSSTSKDRVSFDKMGLRQYFQSLKDK